MSVWIHRDVLGNHANDGEQCWCGPVVIESKEHADAIIEALFQAFGDEEVVDE